MPLLTTVLIACTPLPSQSFASNFAGYAITQVFGEEGIVYPVPQSMLDHSIEVASYINPHTADANIVFRSCILQMLVPFAYQLEKVCNRMEDESHSLEPSCSSHTSIELISFYPVAVRLPGKRGSQRPFEFYVPREFGRWD